MAFLNKMAVTFTVIVIVMSLMTWFKPLKEPKAMAVNTQINLKPAPSVVWLGMLIIIVTIILYILFW